MERCLLACFLLFSVTPVSLWLPFSSVVARVPVRAVVLGVAQDGGAPHIGCMQEPWVAARRDPTRRLREIEPGREDEDARRVRGARVARDGRELPL